MDRKQLVMAISGLINDHSDLNRHLDDIALAKLDLQVRPEEGDPNEDKWWEARSEAMRSFLEEVKQDQRIEV